ncbi:MerR family transcriptional regulator [Bacillus manliponensis]|uniref:MerR family transcriptional regulator n=1 Tax=Bacillus manliponensis TaxID=574376 RepID=A0A073K897_9BACI|nr:MerR family DNA-binding protein [Bacillus manliponensis]KEK18443.1 MerR family transcriptional regulator [Bacillus manliponensis]
MTEKYYSIHEMMSLFDVSSRTIRYYEELGLIQSLERELPNQQRTFTDSQRRRLKLILRGKRLGFSLNEIKEMVDLVEKNPTGEEEKRRIIAYADQKLQEIEEKIQELQTTKEEILAHRQRYLSE